jgi:hypothetical protein
LREGAVILNLDNEQYYSLDEVGVRIWELLGEYKELTEVIKQVQAEYDVEEHVLRRDIAKFLHDLQEATLISVEP